jgi:hypothetical protein
MGNSPLCDAITPNPPSAPSFHLDTSDDDVYLDKLQTRGVKKSILYM